MQNDIISRSALVAELEGFKMSMGDIVLRFVVDRVIERVKAQPGVDAAPMGGCDTCKHTEVDVEAEPCQSCIGEVGLYHPCWAPRL